MSTRRRSSIRVHNKEKGKLRGPEGRRLCRFCNVEVPPNRKTFCSDACVHEWKLRSSGKYLRQFLYQRDLGICANCSTDSRHQKIRVEDAGWEARRRSGLQWRSDSEYAEFLKTERLTVKEAEKSLWQADHVVAVMHGGGECGLDAYQTLCIPCHKEKTSRDRKNKATKAKQSSGRSGS